jgi:hypothetical protein
MKTFFLLIFFKMYAFAEFCSKDKLYQYTAMYLTSLLFFFNLITTLVYCTHFLGLNLGHGNNIFPSKFVIIILLLVIAYVHYLIFVKDDRYKILKEEFEKHPRLKGSFGTLITFVYIALTFALLSSLIWLKTDRRN